MASLFGPKSRHFPYDFISAREAREQKEHQRHELDQLSGGGNQRTLRNRHSDLG